MIPAFGIVVGYYVLAFALLAAVAFVLAEMNGGYDRNCGGISTCNGPDHIVKIAALMSALVLITTGLSGNFVALIAGALLFKQILTGKL